MRKVDFAVTGMSCAACSAAVERAVSALTGVEKAPVNLLTNSMTVFYDDTAYTDEQGLVAAVEAAVKKAGYGASPKSAFAGGKTGGADGTSGARSDEARVSRAPAPQDAQSALKRQFLVSLVLLIPLMYIAMFSGLPPLVSMVAQLILLIPILIVNRRYFTSGLGAMLHGNPTMNSLVATGCTASILYSLASLVVTVQDAFTGWTAGMTVQAAFTGQGAASGMHVYFDSAAMILTIITLGKWLEARGKAKTSRAVEELIKLAPDTAIIETADGEREVPVSEVAPGMTVIVKPGCRIPVDGTVSGGSSRVDESAITGESVPVAKEEGDAVTAATMNLSGKLRVLVTAVGKDTSFSKIIALVEEASASKAPIARAADTAARYFVPAVLAIAAVTFIVWLACGASLAFALTSAVSVLVISCPCALGLATPVAIMAGTGQGAKNGILFKDGAVLEALCKIDTVVLDKTGTLTKGIVKDVPAGNTAGGPTASTSADGTVASPAVDTSADTIREDSPAAVARLKEMGLSVIMLSGDKEDRAHSIAAQCGIDEVIAGVKPDGKEEVIRDLQEKGRKVAMIGDGINDAPALTRAEAGIAIGAGTDVAIESADVILVRSSLMDAASAFTLSRKVIRIIKQNLFWALCYNAACIPLAAGAFYHALGWQLNPMMGSACMGLSSICVVTNALRLTRMKLREDASSSPDTLSEAEAANKASDASKTCGPSSLPEAACADKAPDASKACEPGTLPEAQVADKASDSCKACGPVVKQEKSMRDVEIVIDGMMCSHCSGRVEKALNALEGVEATVDLDKKTAFVKADASVTDGALAKAVTDAGYDVVSVK